jgi:hypothetical protein
MKLRKKLDKAVEARRVARKSGLAPGATRVIPDKRTKPSKRKKDLIEDQMREAEEI